MFKKILVAIDNSASAACAVQAAERFAAQVGGELLLLHVIDPISRVPAEAIGRFEPTLEQMQETGNALLAQIRERLSGDVPVTTQLLEGDVPQVIVSTAVAEGADLIVIGTDSRGRLAHFLLGSTADAVIRYAPCPVMAVRANRKPSRSAMDRMSDAALLI